MKSTNNNEIIEMKKLNLKITNEGIKKRLVFINPLGSSSRIWNDLIDKLNCFEIVTYNYPGLSDTSYFTIHSVQEYSELLEKELISLPRKPTVIIGYSLGGWVAQQIAINKNIPIEGLALLASSQRVHPKGEIIMRHWENILLTMGKNEFFKELALWSFSAEFFLRSPNFVDHFVTTLLSRETHENFYLDQIRLALNYTQLQPIKDISAPTLIVKAEDDILYPNFGTKELLDLIPNSRLATVKAGHALLQENADDVFFKLYEFLKEVIPTSISKATL